MEQLKNITKTGAPESRLNDSKAVLSMVHDLIRADEPRAKVRARVKGLVDGNSPYNSAELKRIGQSHRCNVNFREAESFVNMALSAFYDVFAEVRHYAKVQCNHGDVNQREEYSRILTEEFDRLQKQDGDFDYLMQLSQHEMVLYGSGPLLFEDSFDWRCKPIKCGDLLIPDGTKSNVGDFSVAVVRSSYQVHELYSFIRDNGVASAAGWDVEAAKDAIMKASPSTRGRKSQRWEAMQQEIRNNDLAYSSRCDTIEVAHVFYREFPDDKNPQGAISHCIVDERGTGKSFLFRKVGRYENWQQCLHVMMYDKGDGKLHGVKGLGVKMYSALELKNRLRCDLVDAAKARSSIMLKPTSPNAQNKMNIVNMGSYTVLPADFDVQQTAAGGVLDAPLAVERELEGMLQANLSQYRQRLDKQGNPRTATEIQAIVSQQSVLGKTQLNRYYIQLDALFNERYRRAASSILTKDVAGGAMALEFQQRCINRGVPPEALEKAQATASRTAGAGSAMERRAVMNQLLDMSGMLPEGGREHVIKDAIASMTGFQALDRYFPSPEKDVSAQEQMQEAARENVLFKQGAVTPVAGLDNHLIHSQVHLTAAAEAVGGAQQGQADISEVLTFLGAVMKHVEGHEIELSKDKTRGGAVKQIAEQKAQIIKIAKQLAAQLEQQERDRAEAQQAQQEMAMIQSGQDPKEAVAQARFERDEARRDAKLQNDLQRKTQKTQQDMALKDAKAAQHIGGN